MRKIAFFKIIEARRALKAQAALPGLKVALFGAVASVALLACDPTINLNFGSGTEAVPSGKPAGSASSTPEVSSSASSEPAASASAAAGASASPAPLLVAPTVLLTARPISFIQPSASPSAPTGLLRVGRKWSYKTTSNAFGVVNFNGDIRLDVVTTGGDLASVRKTLTAKGSTETKDFNLDLKEASPHVKVFFGDRLDPTRLRETRQENLAVSAGIFACTKLTYELTPSSLFTGTAELWLSADNTLIKYVGKSQAKPFNFLPPMAPEGFPPLTFSLPTNLNQSETSWELASFSL